MIYSFIDFSLTISIFLFIIFLPRQLNALSLYLLLNSLLEILFISSSFKLVIISNEKNIGTGLSRNNGLDIATGKYITFVDNDDYIDENYLQYLYNIAINQNVDFAACGVDMAYDNGTIDESIKFFNIYIFKQSF